jgi:acyl-CoA reductase-like NAD-dependent aldehyde dehydrogenase
MESFNIICNWSGCVSRIIKAESLQKAIDICNAKGYDIQDDYFLESVKQTAERDAKVGRVLYNEDER